MPKSILETKADYETRKALIEMGMNETDLFDYSPSPSDLYDIPIVDGLSEEDRKRAKALKRFYYGLMLVTGRTGAGKGIFTIYLLHNMKRLFGRKVMLDYKPRKAFGPYIPINEEVLMGELGKMQDIAVSTGQKPKSVRSMKKEEQTALAEAWVSTRGSVFMHGAAIGLDELKRYFHNRRPHNPMGITWGHVITIHRHMDLLIIGMSPYEREIDAISFLPYVTHRAICSQRTDGRTKVDIYQTVWVGEKGVLEARMRPYTMVIDGLSPRPELNGLRYVDLYNSKDPKALKVSGTIEKYEG